MRLTMSIVPLAALLPRSEPVSSRTRWAIVWGGLRGAVPMALILSLQEDFPYRQDLSDMTLTMIMFTLLVKDRFRLGPGATRPDGCSIGASGADRIQRDG